MLKKLLLGTMVLGSLVFADGISKENKNTDIKSSESKTLEESKTHMMAKINGQMKKLENQTVCVKNAKDKKELRKCKSKKRDGQKSKKRDVGKSKNR